MALTVTRQGGICTTSLLGAVPLSCPPAPQSTDSASSARTRLPGVVERGHNGRRPALSLRW